MHPHDPDNRHVDASALPDPRVEARTRRGRLKMVLLLLFCASPVIASYFTYYVIRPAGGKTNYGTLIQPQRPIPEQFQVMDEQGGTQPLSSFKGKWLLMTVHGSACNAVCTEQLFLARQTRVSQGPERERVVPIWMITDDGPIDPKLSAAYNDQRSAMRFLRVSESNLAEWLPIEAGGRLEDHLFLVDPIGNLMMRFPAQADPAKVRSEMIKLLKYNRVG
jgi:hypothetical protein